MPNAIIRDAEIEGMLRHWSAPIIRAAGLDPDAVRLILVQSPDVNAFVAGGQNIFIYTGLLMKTETPDEVVGVIAHELGHIAGGHLVRGTAEMERASYEVMLGAILGLGAAAATGSGDAATAIISGSSALAQRKFLSFSRTQESAADQAGLRFMRESGTNPYGLLAFMKTLANQELLPTSQQNEYVRTHPLSRDRVATLEQSLQDDPAPTTSPRAWAEDHRRMKAKLMGYLTPAQVPWAYLDDDRSISADYARALMHYRQNAPDQALLTIQSLIAREPKNPYFHELKGQMLYDFGRLKDAAAAYSQAYALVPGDALIQLAYAQALIETPGVTQKQVAQARSLLGQIRLSDPKITRTYRLLATIEGRQGREPEAQVWLAEEAFLQARFDESRRLATRALDQLAKDSRPHRLAQDLLAQLDQVDQKDKD